MAESNLVSTVWEWIENGASMRLEQRQMLRGAVRPLSVRRAILLQALPGCTPAATIEAWLLPDASLFASEEWTHVGGVLWVRYFPEGTPIIAMRTATTNFIERAYGEAGKVWAHALLARVEVVAACAS